MKQTVKREERLRVRIAIIYPDPQKNKTYFDNNRHYTIKVDKELERVGENIVNEENKPKFEHFRLRALIVVKKKYKKTIDSTFTYRVGENFARLKVKGCKEETIVAVDFTDGNFLSILDDCSHIKPSRILN